MSQFTNINFEYKLRVPLSAYAENIIENDCVSFSRKRNTLINLIILNFYRFAECSVSLRLNEYREELKRSIPKTELKKNKAIIDTIIKGRGRELKKKYAVKIKSETSKPVTLSKKVNELLTLDPESAEELYYNDKPSLYLTALLEEYSRLPYYKREEIVFKNIINEINTAIDCDYPIKLSNTNGRVFNVRPYSISSDPLSMYHYIVGISSDNSLGSANVALRLSRIADVEIKYYQDGTITAKEEDILSNDINKKGIQFLSSEKSEIAIKFTDLGLRYYRTRQHLRPTGVRDKKDPYLFHFECTETQILFYFLSFGKEAKVIAPEELKKKFKEFYSEGLKNYK